MFGDLKMGEDFYKIALAAAKEGPQAFEKIFNQTSRDDNVRHSINNEHLIEAIIITCSDENLPLLLDTLVKNGVDLQLENRSGQTPLSLACCYLKKNAVEYLLQHNPNFNVSNPPICSVLGYRGSEDNSSKICEIIEILLDNSADINATNSENASALYYATSFKYLDVMKFLVSKGACLYSTETYELYDPILVVAYRNYMSVKRFNLNKDYEVLNKECFDFILHTAFEQIKNRALGHDNELQCIKEAIEQLCGKFQDSYNECDNNSLSKILVPDPIKFAKEIRLSKVTAFGMGSLSRSPLFNFFKSDGEGDLIRHIFSFVADSHSDKKGSLKRKLDSVNDVGPQNNFR